MVIAAMVVDLAGKLRLTALLLGCDSAAALCARFRDFNDATECRPDRVRDWLRGRAQPRTRRLFEDWVRLLGVDRPGKWIQECGFAVFATELESLHGDRVTGLAAQALRGRGRPAATDTGYGHAHLRGAYACYSQAWSPAHRGQIIRGALRIRERDGAGLEAAYSETLLGDAMQVEGSLEVTSGTVYMLLREPGSGLPVFIALSVPAAPITLMAGIMAGPCFVVDHSLPTGTRIVAIRVPDGIALEASNRYLPPGDTDFTADLADLGLPVRPKKGLNRLLANFLPKGADQVDDNEIAALREVLRPLG
jgi:hypothetical protein